MDRGITDTSVEAAKSRADWRRVSQIYEQVSEIASDPEEANPLPLPIAGALAEALGRVFASYDGGEETFIDDVLAIWSDTDGLAGVPADRLAHLYGDTRFDRFADYGVSAGRRRPKPFEATLETVRRLRDLNRIGDGLQSTPTSCILGGSASYGRFFNTAGAIAANPSDLDLLLVIRDYDELDAVAEGIARSAPVTGIAAMKERVAGFPAVLRDGRPDERPCIFSQKLDLWETDEDPLLARTGLAADYKLSIHVVSNADFDYLTLREHPGILGDIELSLWDYRDSPAARLDNQRCFAGIDVTLPRKVEKVEGGYLAESRVCHTESERFFPGLHQNLVLPQFDLRWEMNERRLYLPLLAFRWKIVERLRDERRLRPYEVQKVSLSHTRSAVFAPHITKRVDSHE